MSTTAAPTLLDLRHAIDATDQKILALLNERARYAHQVGEIKRAEGSAVFRPEREAQVIQTLQQSNQGPLERSNVAHIWREIMSACRSLEAPQRVAFLGPEGTFSQQAALEFFGSSIAPVLCSTIDEVFQATSSGQAQFGVVPVENSTEGVVTRSLDLFLQAPVHIVGEVSLLVRHHLLRGALHMDGIRAVYAHPQALAQCQQWLNLHLPDVERIAASSNAEGARLAKEQGDAVAIASERAASIHGLHIVRHAIQDDAYNRTRFAVMCLPKTLEQSQPTGNDCISLVVAVPNKPGAMHDLLVPLKQHGVSMTRVESRPAKAGPLGEKARWEYYFYIDIVGHPSDAPVQAALAELQKLCSFFRILGAYPNAD